MIPRLGDGNDNSHLMINFPYYSLENDSPSRGRKPIYIPTIEEDDDFCLENDSPSRGRKRK